MTLRNRARELAKEEVAKRWRQMRRNKVDPDDERNWPVRDIRDTVEALLKTEVDTQGKQRFGSWEIWFYVFFSLGKIILELIRERRKETWRMGPVQ